MPAYFVGKVGVFVLNKDLTTGRPETVLWRFCLPLFGSIIFQQLYNIADSLVAGKFVGENALAAIGNSYEVTLIFIAFAFGCNIGCSVVVSQLFGAKEYNRMKTAIYTAGLFSAGVCILLMLLGYFGCDPILEAIHTPAEVFQDSKIYLDIYVWGLPFVFFYNIATGIFSALGDSRTPFLFLAFSSTANVAVDILFVTAFDMGVAGVAWATFLCQGVSCILAVVTVWKRLQGVHTTGKVELFSLPLLRRFVIIAIPSILQQSFISVGNLLIQGVINGFGSGVMAGYSASVKINNLVITSYTTIGNGISNYTAQNMGAGKWDRIRAGFKAGIKLVWLLTIPFFLIYFFCGNVLLGFFIDNPTQTALDTGIRFLRILSPFYFIVSAKLVADGILRGSGIMGKFMIATFTDLILRVGLAFLLSGTVLGSTGIWCAWPVGWTVAAVLSLIFYRQQIVGREVSESDPAPASETAEA